MDEFKRFFLRGLAAVLPTLLTIAVFLWAYSLVDTYLGQHITRGMLNVMCLLGEPSAVDAEEDSLLYGDPIDRWIQTGPWAGIRDTAEHNIITSNALHSTDDLVKKRAERARTRALWRIAFSKYKLGLVGFLIAIIVVYFVGLFLASFIGRTTLRLVERTVSRMPLVGAIYPNIKQVTDFLFSESKLEFSGVVAVPYPRKGIWSVGLLTGRPMGAIKDQTDGDLVTVFIPSSPAPVTGYTITVPREDLLVLDISIDEALRFIISAGVVKPDTKLLTEPSLGRSAPSLGDATTKNEET
ncbi:MAG: membrane protein [Phycisphaerae bacterium]|nr:MAG: membrane protein [Phycisphaerae bacterium]